MSATLEDLYREVWLRMRNNGSLTWTTKDGTVIPIKDMSDTHLANTILMLERHKEEAERSAEEWEHLGEMDPLEYYD